LDGLGGAVSDLHLVDESAPRPLVGESARVDAGRLRDEARPLLLEPRALGAERALPAEEPAEVERLVEVTREVVEAPAEPLENALGQRLGARARGQLERDPEREGVDRVVAALEERRARERVEAEE